MPLQQFAVTSQHSPTPSDGVQIHQQRFCCTAAARCGNVNCGACREPRADGVYEVCTDARLTFGMLADVAEVADDFKAKRERLRDTSDLQAPPVGSPQHALDEAAFDSVYSALRPDPQRIMAGIWSDARNQLLDYAQLAGAHGAVQAHTAAPGVAPSSQDPLPPAVPE